MHSEVHWSIWPPSAVVATSMHSRPLAQPAEAEQVPPTATVPGVVQYVTTSLVLVESFARAQVLPGGHPAFVSGVQGIVQMDVPISLVGKQADGLDGVPRFLQSASVEHETWHVLSTQAVAGEAQSLTVVHAAPSAAPDGAPASVPDEASTQRPYCDAPEVPRLAHVWPGVQFLPPMVHSEVHSPTAPPSAVVATSMHSRPLAQLAEAEHVPPRATVPGVVQYVTTSLVLVESVARLHVLPAGHPAFVSGVHGIEQMEVPISVEPKHADGLDAEPSPLQSASVEHVTWHVLSTQAVSGEAQSLTVVHAAPSAAPDGAPASMPDEASTQRPYCDAPEVPRLAHVWAAGQFLPPMVHSEVHSPIAPPSAAVPTSTHSRPLAQPADAEQSPPRATVPAPAQ